MHAIMIEIKKDRDALQAMVVDMRNERHSINRLKHFIPKIYKYLRFDLRESTIIHEITDGAAY